MARTVPAVNRAFDILELFEAHDELTAAQIIATLGLPRTTVGELLNTLVDRGYLLLTDVKSKRLRLGLRVFRLGSVYADRLDLAAEARVASQAVAQACGETVQVAVLDGPAVVYIAKVDSIHSVRLVSAIGRSLPAHCTAVGKMLLAGLSADQFDALYAQAGELSTLTANSISTVPALRAELEEIRSCGLAREVGESNVDVECVAAPVYSRASEMVAAMSIAVPTSRLTGDTRAELAEQVRQGAEELSARLGHRGPGQLITP